MNKTVVIILLLILVVFSMFTVMACSAKSSDTPGQAESIGQVSGTVPPPVSTPTAPATSTK